MISTRPNQGNGIYQVFANRDLGGYDIDQMFVDGTIAERTRRGQRRKPNLAAFGKDVRT